MRVRRPKLPALAYWIVGFGLLAFGVPEAAAVIDPTPGDTLSESSAWVIAAAPGMSGEIVMWVFFAALGWHFTAGRGTDWPWTRLLERRRQPDPE